MNTELSVHVVGRCSLLVVSVLSSANAALAETVIELAKAYGIDRDLSCARSVLRSANPCLITNMLNLNYNPKYNPHLREQYSIAGCILFDYLQNIFGDKTALPLSKREIATALCFSKAEINLAFKELVKEYKTSTEYKQATDKFSGKLYCAYTIRGRGVDAQASYIFRNHEPALKSIELVKPDFDFTA